MPNGEVMRRVVELMGGLVTVEEVISLPQAKIDQLAALLARRATLDPAILRLATGRILWGDDMQSWPPAP